MHVEAGSGFEFAAGRLYLPCASAAVSSVLRSASESDGVWERFLPDDCAEILSRSTGKKCFMLASSQLGIAWREYARVWGGGVGLIQPNRGQPTRSRYSVVLGDDPKPKQMRSSFPSKRPDRIFNHYANGSGWWDFNMEKKWDAQAHLSPCQPIV
ncbi:hypothetical protein H6P81_019188 [Aristolochia fimbriata]|uniref:Uncharacterized protein n=1 Tax=Aristolochia fimbriata TaxID=158543 RepID=A0AAV7DVQ4_ARIFI|nr:hypothetical protein H6P81_019188 [Aristolochia fimbriata]